ncbi:adhesin biosynthesis transcription regulatory family protein [Escherichia coli]|uniref:adhesin biosynthesis transcription regulatory family protein n=1 Tax=Escherichia coli TaxID=562 RepID=UPI0019D25F2B|nr:adhesin biosynthesis transcription regulatory family protein [Escherichia coli]MBN6378147.1 adhesin biosynthesis transcription regulatory family protein [Escherichia coli]
MSNSDLYLSKKHGRILSPGKMSDSQFWLLAEISPVHSEKVLNALRDFLVLGYARKEACERNEVSPGYFSGALGRISHVNYIVSSLASYYGGSHLATGDSA